MKQQFKSEIIDNSEELSLKFLQEDLYNEAELTSLKSEILRRIKAVLIPKNKSRQSLISQLWCLLPVLQSVLHIKLEFPSHGEADEDV